MNILIIDDEENIRRTTAIALKSMGHEVFQASDSASALKSLAAEDIHAAFLDLKLGTEEGLELLPKLMADAPSLNVVVFTAHASIETAVQAVKSGATDYVEKPFTPDQIRVVLGKIERTRKLQDRINELEFQLSSSSPKTQLNSSKAPGMDGVFKTAAKAAKSEAHILVTGESGTGKSVLAGMIHQNSGRRAQSLVTVSCPSLTQELLASELFGHIRGAFTGAIKDRWGKVAQANGGTLFLDEIGDLPLDLQPKLLRLLQEKEYERVGETQTRQADVRVIAATNRDLEEAVKDGAFREDLFYRLNVITIRMPSLRERREDLEDLIGGYLSFFCAQCGKAVNGFSDRAWQRIRAYDWPGNLRELRNFVERAVILSETDTLEADGLMEPGSGGEGSGNGGVESVSVGHLVSLKDLEAVHIKRVVEATATMEEAAKVLGIDPATLYRKRKRLGL